MPADPTSDHHTEHVATRGDRPALATIHHQSGGVVWSINGYRVNNELDRTARTE